MWLGVLIALVAPAAGLIPQFAYADTTPAVNWVQSPAQGPSGRLSAYMAFDSGRNRTVLFGGVFQGTTFPNTYFSDTWEFDGTTWSQIQVSGPPAGALGQMVYDSARGVSVLFGGGDNNGFLAPITWEWNGATWTPRFTTHRPPARVWSGMTYDSGRHVVVLFGGSGQDAAGNHILLNDTWEYNGADWLQVTTAHSPSGRYGLGLAYDSGRSKTVLFGGHDDTTGRLNDTWEYNGTDWMQVSIADPPAARFLHSMAYVAALGKTVAFGGDYFVPGVTLGPNNETWLFDGASWQLLATANSPSPRSMAAAAYDSAHSSLILFGGGTELTPFPNYSDTWALVVPVSAATFSASSVQFPAEPVFSTTSQDVTLTNTGTAPLAVSSISAGGDFTNADNCPRAPATVAINASCTITVKFTPTSGDVPRSGTLTVTDNVPGGVQSIPLSGSGVWGQLSASSETLGFGASPINPSGPTATATETLTFPGPATILTGFTADVPFFVNNLDCPTGIQLGSGATCHVQVGFGPTTAGTYSGHAVILDNEPGLRHPIAVSGTANPIPVTVALAVGSNTPAPSFGGLLNVQATANSPFGMATFTFNGQTFAPVDLGGFGVASIVIPLDDSTIPAGAGTYPLLVTVHPTDNIHSDSSVSQTVTVVPGAAQLSSNGSTLTSTGTPSTLSATVTVPNVFPQPQFDFSTNPVWVRFDVIGSAGTVTTYYALAGSSGVASVGVSGLPAGAYTVRATLVSSSSSAAPNPYLTSNVLRSAFALSPTKGGFVAGGGQQGTTTVGFEFTPGATPGGSLAWVEVVQALGSDGQQHLVYAVITSTSVASVTSHSHSATVTGQATMAFFDLATGAHLASLDRTTAFEVDIAGDGSFVVTASATGLNVGFPAGSAVNHL